MSEKAKLKKRLMKMSHEECALSYMLLADDKHKLHEKLAAAEKKIIETEWDKHDLIKKLVAAEEEIIGLRKNNMETMRDNYDLKKKLEAVRESLKAEAAKCANDNTHIGNCITCENREGKNQCWTQKQLRIIGEASP